MGIESQSWDHKFQIWAFSASHGQLLLRGFDGSRQPRRIEILFKDVVALSIRAFAQGLKIEEVSIADLGDLTLKLSDYQKWYRGYRLIGDCWSGYVVGGAVFFSEDDLDSGAPSGAGFRLGGHERSIWDDE